MKRTKEIVMLLVLSVALVIVPALVYPLLWSELQSANNPLYADFIFSVLFVLSSLLFFALIVWMALAQEIVRKKN